MENITKKAEAMSVKEDAQPKLGFKPLAKKLPPNKQGERVEIATNIRKIEMVKNRPIFKYAVTIEIHYKKADGSVSKMEVSKSSKKGAAGDVDRNRCQKVYLMAAAKLAPLRALQQCWYDRQAALYTLEKIKGQDMEMEFTEDVSQASNFLKAVFRLQTVANTFQASSNDIVLTTNICPALADKTLIEAMNVITSGAPNERSNVITIGSCVHYLLDPENYDLDTTTFPAGHLYSATGAMKAVKTLEGFDEKPALFMTTELKETVFHPDNATLLDIFQSFDEFKPNMPAEHASRILKTVLNMECFLNYGQRRNTGDDRLIIKIKGFAESAAKSTFNYTDETGKTVKITVLNYFRDKYNIPLKYPNLFTIECEGRGGKKMRLPVELLAACDSQKVTTAQMQNKEQAVVVKKTAAPPHIRHSRTIKVGDGVGLSSKEASNQELYTIGAPITVTGVVLPFPKILFEKNTPAQLPNLKSRVPTDFEMPAKFYEPATLKKWEMVFIENDGIHGLDVALMKQMKDSGMTYEVPKITYFHDTDLESVFQNAKKRGSELLFFVIRQRYELHQQSKIFEQKYDILTQDIKLETAEKFFRQPQTRQNVVNKTNIKLGGHNYRIMSEFFNSGTLIVGFATASHGGGGDGPICIGYSANMHKNFQKFTGGYVFTQRGSELYGSIIPSTFTKIFETCKKNKAPCPQEIIVYFNGVTAGQYAVINEIYLKQIEDACSAFAKTFVPTITLFATSKTHNERLYLKNGRNLSNLAPGTVIDHTIVPPNLNEFYLASSVARQGTTKAAKYTLVCTSHPNPSMRRYETLTNDLCYNHQIVFQPISLPVPLYAAECLSERGATLLAHVGPTTKRQDGQTVVDYAATNQALGYEDKKLFNTRFNA